jgi:hypothetical protein
MHGGTYNWTPNLFAGGQGGWRNSQFDTVNRSNLALAVVNANTALNNNPNCYGGEIHPDRRFVSESYAEVQAFNDALEHAESVLLQLATQAEIDSAATALNAARTAYITRFNQSWEYGSATFMLDGDPLKAVSDWDRLFSATTSVTVLSDVEEYIHAIDPNMSDFFSVNQIVLIVEEGAILTVSGSIQLHHITNHGTIYFIDCDEIPAPAISHCMGAINNFGVIKFRQTGGTVFGALPVTNYADGTMYLEDGGFNVGSVIVNNGLFVLSDDVFVGGTTIHGGSNASVMALSGGISVSGNNFFNISGNPIAAAVPEGTYLWQNDRWEQVNVATVGSAPPFLTLNAALEHVFNTAQPTNAISVTGNAFFKADSALPWVAELGDEYDAADYGMELTIMDASTVLLYNDLHVVGLDVIGNSTLVLKELEDWVEFSILPAVGNEATINGTIIIEPDAWFGNQAEMVIGSTGRVYVQSEGYFSNYDAILNNNGNIVLGVGAYFSQFGGTTINEGVITLKPHADMSLYDGGDFQNQNTGTLRFNRYSSLDFDDFGSFTNHGVLALVKHTEFVNFTNGNVAIPSFIDATTGNRGVIHAITPLVTPINNRPLFNSAFFPDANTTGVGADTISRLAEGRYLWNQPLAQFVFVQ